MKDHLIPIIDLNIAIGDIDLKQLEEEIRAQLPSVEGISVRVKKEYCVELILHCSDNNDIIRTEPIYNLVRGHRPKKKMKQLEQATEEERLTKIENVLKDAGLI